MTRKHRNPRLVPRDWNNTTMQWEYVCPACGFLVASITAEAVHTQWGIFPDGKPGPWVTHNCPGPTPTPPHADQNPQLPHP